MSSVTQQHRNNVSPERPEMGCWSGEKSALRAGWAPAGLKLRHSVVYDHLGSVRNLLIMRYFIQCNAAFYTNSVNSFREF